MARLMAAFAGLELLALFDAIATKGLAIGSRRSVESTTANQNRKLTVMKLIIVIPQYSGRLSSPFDIEFDDNYFRKPKRRYCAKV